MPRLAKLQRPADPQVEKQTARVALVQLDYNPSYRFKIDYLVEPLGLSAATETAVSTVQLNDRSLEEVLRAAVRQVRERYLANLSSRVNIVLNAIENLGVDLVCFPEYSIPPALFESLLPFAKKYGLVLPSHVASPASLRELSDFFGQKELAWIPGQALYVAAPRGPELEAYVMAKVTRSRFEPSLALGEGAYPLPLLGPNTSVLALMCSDFIQGRDFSSSSRTQNPALTHLEHAALRVVCALTPSTGPFFDLATQDILRGYSAGRRPTAFVNHALEGGTSLFALMEDEQVLESHDRTSSYRLPAMVEGVAIFDVALGPQLEIRPSPLTPEPRSQLVGLRVLQDATEIEAAAECDLRRLADQRRGATDGVKSNIEAAFRLLGERATDDTRCGYDPIELGPEASFNHWRLEAALHLTDVLRSLIPSADTQTRDALDPRLRALENFATRGQPTVRTRSAGAVVTSAATGSETEVERVDEQGRVSLETVVRLTGLPRSAPVEDVIGPLWSLVQTVANNPALTISVEYEIMRAAEVGGADVLTEFTIEMFVVTRYELGPERDRSLANRTIHDVKQVLQTGFGDLYRFTPVSGALRDTYRRSQAMSYRVFAGHGKTTEAGKAFLLPYRGQPLIGGVLRYLFARSKPASLHLSISALRGSTSAEYLQPAAAADAPSVPQKPVETLSDALRVMDLLHLFRPSGQTPPERPFCRLQIGLALSDQPSPVVPEMVFRELLGDEFAQQDQRCCDEQSTVSGTELETGVLDDCASVRECLTLIRFPTGPLPSFGDRTTTAHVQVPIEVAENDQGCMLGHAYHEDAPDTIPIFLSDSDRRKHVYVIGKTGTGKTQFLLNMIMQDIEAGKGVCVMDPHGDLFEDVLARYPAGRARDLVMFDPTDSENPPGLNLFEHDRRNPMHRDFILDETVSIFLRLHGNEMFGPRIQNYFRNAALALMTDPSRERTLLDVSRIFLDDEFFSYIMDASSDPAVADFLTEFRRTAEREKTEMIPYFQAKFAPFVSNSGIRNVIGQSRSTVNFRQAMDLNRVVLVNLAKGKLGELNSKLLGMVMVSKVTWAALSRAHLAPDQRSDFCVYCDEFQNFATDAFVTILSEARKYGLCLTLGNQYLSQLRISDNYTSVHRDSLRDAVLGNAGNIVVFRVGARDAKELVEEIAADSSIKDRLTGLLSSQPRFRAVVRLDCSGRSTHAFTLNTRLTTAREDMRRSSLLRDLVRAQTLLPRDFVLADIASSRTDFQSDGGYMDRES
jgi:hypothetical protein